MFSVWQFEPKEGGDVRRVPGDCVFRRVCGDGAARVGVESVSVVVRRAAAHFLSEEELPVFGGVYGERERGRWSSDLCRLRRCESGIHGGSSGLRLGKR
ncbi:hypothetical protein LINGRAHAP2_LOCUS32712 [Linum grandiflorum]